MSWSDIFYPENPEKRHMLTSKNQELQELMKNNFRATNQLIETLNKHLNLSFSPITLNEKATVKENCDVIIERVHEIQAEVEKIDKRLKEKLEPTLYEKLKNISLSVHEYTVPLGDAVLEAVFMGIGMVIGAIAGKIEHDQLEEALKEYDKALEEFSPVSEQFQESITYVRIKLELNY